MTEKDLGTRPRTTIELYHLYGRAVARIKRNGRDKNYFHVTPASRARIGMYVFMRTKQFRVEPYVTGLVGWTADKKDQEATE